ncbi:MAG: ABC transporter permease [Chloroflexi bacterium]|nr:ABC transporter permease [Chloroflexota bacterium]
MAEQAQTQAALALPARMDAPRPRARPALLRSPLTIAGLALMAVFVACALTASVLAPYDPIKQFLSQRLKPPSPEHWMGTDQLGRDLFSRMLFGAQISLTIGVGVVAPVAVFGTILGLVAGYAGGLLDEILMRVTDVFLAFPPLILAMAIAGALGPSLTNAMIAIAVVSWPVYVRLVRGQVLSLRQREFVEAARAIGASTPRILSQHLLPNLLAPLLVQATFDLGGTILIAAGLSFIGFGAQIPTPEWGVMISDGRKYVTTQPWLPLFPGLAILVTVAAFNLIGDGLRDALDPRLRGNL